MVLYVRNMFLWENVLKGEIKRLGQGKTRCNSPKAQALNLIETKCIQLLKGRANGKALLDNIPDDIRSVAALFHPSAPKPELRVTPSHIFSCLERSLDRLDRIRFRPGFSELSKVSVGEIKQLYQCYRDFVSPGPSGRPTYSQLIRLVKKIHLLLYVRYLLVDLYLFLGQLAISVYGEDASYLMDEKKIDLEQTLRELSRIKAASENTLPPELMSIRNNLVGMPGILTCEPGVKTWKQAVTQAATRISSKHFPESATPLTEAKIGPLITQIHVFLGRLGKGEDYPLAGKIFKIRLETLFQAKSITDTLIPPQVRRIVMNTQKTYGWLKWPLNLYMFASKGIFWKIAVDLGWFAGRKAILVLIFGKSFDKAVHELEALYMLSSGRPPVKSLVAYTPDRR